MKFKSALIITTYNWPEALELVLLSLKNQVVYPTEVIIADDGSTDDTKFLIEEFQKDFPIPLTHVWHKDNGYRKSAILNLAISRTDADYIIQLDGDCMIHNYFVQDHLSSAEKGIYLYGSRVNIQEPFLPKLFTKKIIKFPYFSEGIKKHNRNIHLPFLGSLLYNKQGELSRKLRGCNLSYWKMDFIAVNGYNEDMSGWGAEDSELIVRMMNIGILGKRMKFKAIIYHIWHKESSKKKSNVNDTIKEQTIKEKKVWCNNGIDKYISEK